jgi:uncharacterized membrane protein YkvA (DUF1232 family)
VHIELEVRPDDLSIAPLRSAWQGAARRHRGRHDALADAALQRFAAVNHATQPSVVREPLSRVPSIARLLTDRNWQVDDAAREQFAGALAYFVDPDDLIPDDGSHFGFLDDALVIKLVLAEAQHEWFAWCDYSDYIAAHPHENGLDRASWLLRRRERLDIELRKRNDQGYAPDGRRNESFSERYAPADRAPGRFGVR